MLKEFILNLKLFFGDRCVLDIIYQSSFSVKFGWSCTKDNKSCSYYQIWSDDTEFMRIVYQIGKQLKTTDVDSVVIYKDEVIVAKFKFDAGKYQLTMGSKYSSVSFFKEDING